MGILIGVFCVVIFMDWRFYRIPNICIAIGMAAGLILTGVNGSVAKLIVLVGEMTVIFLFLYPFYLLKTLGAGDIKLFMMTACYIRGEQLLCYLFVSMFLAALISIFKMVLYKESRERLFYLGRYVRKVSLTGTIDTYQVDKTQKRSMIRLSVPAFLSLLLLCVGIY
jgi:Flp pilus assembly protein, protease CpaA